MLFYRNPEYKEIKKARGDICVFADIASVCFLYCAEQGNHEVISRAGSSLKGRFRRSSTIIELELNLCCKFRYILTSINLAR